MKLMNVKPTRLMAMRDVVTATSLSASSIRRLSREHKFPQPVQITECRIAWLEEEVNLWISETCKKGSASNDN